MQSINCHSRPEIQTATQSTLQNRSINQVELHGAQLYRISGAQSAGGQLLYSWVGLLFAGSYKCNILQHENKVNTREKNRRKKHFCDYLQIIVKENDTEITD